MNKHLFCRLMMTGLFAGAGTGWAAPTPMTEPLKEDGMTLIECDVRDVKENFAILKAKDEVLSDSQKITGYHYKLYLPMGYYENKDYRYPCLFIASPGGNAEMGVMAERLKRDQWIVVMLVESKNESSDWLWNVYAAHDDVVERVRIAKGAKFATGLSGGARVSSVFPIVRPGMAGILCQAAGFAYGFDPPRNLYEEYTPETMVACSFGDTDSNLFESMEILRKTKKSRTQARFFKGGHAWCPERTFNSLMDWLEESAFLASTKPAMKTGARPVVVNKGTASKRAAKSEPLSPEAFQWYLRKCKRVLGEAQGAPERAWMLERMLAVVANGKLEQNKAVAAEAQAWKAELAKLKQTKEVIEFTRTAGKAYLDAQAAEATCLAMLKRGVSEYGKLKVSSAERQALTKMVAAYRAVETKYPESPCAGPSKEVADSWEVALAKAL